MLTDDDGHHVIAIAQMLKTQSTSSLYQSMNFGIENLGTFNSLKMDRAMMRVTGIPFFNTL
jgi:hypothetical protein